MEGEGEMKYIVISRYRKDEFAIEVNNKLSEGWQCQGGVAVADDIYYQAMIKEEYIKVVDGNDTKEN